jgi:predicted Zn-dependent protease
VARSEPPSDAATIQQSANRKNAAIAPRNFAKDDTCLLPPLNLSTSAPVSARQLEVPGNVRKEYQQACVALKDKKTADAEKHLRRAVQLYPKYPAAWVTLGQMLAALPSGRGPSRRLSFLAKVPRNRNSVSHAGPYAR